MLNAFIISDYTLRKSLEEAKKKETKGKEIVDEHKQMDLNTEIELKKEEFSGENETLTFAETEEKLTETQKELAKLKLIVGGSKLSYYKALFRKLQKV